MTAQPRILKRRGKHTKCRRVALCWTGVKRERGGDDVQQRGEERERGKERRERERCDGPKGSKDARRSAARVRVRAGKQ